MTLKSWSAKDVDALRALWGKETSAIIAVKIGKTRCAVIGKANRLGLPKQHAFEHIKHAPKRKPPEPLGLEDKNGVSLFDLEADQCKAIYMNNAYCGKKIVDGSYCKRHAKKYYVKTKPYKYD
jgi:GcrA cell cycle regulator